MLHYPDVSVEVSLETVAASGKNRCHSVLLIAASNLIFSSGTSTGLNSNTLEFEFCKSSDANGAAVTVIMPSWWVVPQSGSCR